MGSCIRTRHRLALRGGGAVRARERYRHHPDDLEHPRAASWNVDDRSGERNSAQLLLQHSSHARIRDARGQVHRRHRLRGERSSPASAAFLAHEWTQEDSHSRFPHHPNDTWPGRFEVAARRTDCGDDAAKHLRPRATRGIRDCFGETGSVGCPDAARRRHSRAQFWRGRRADELQGHDAAGYCVINLWHELAPGIHPPDNVTAVIEFPAGSRNKYELDKTSGMIRLDRALYSAVHYPGDYGFIPRTLHEDGDPLDVLVHLNEPTFPGCQIDCRPLGVLRMLDRGEPDDKILAVPCQDPYYHEHFDIADISQPHLREVQAFFHIYKDLEGRRVEIVGWEKSEIAARVIHESIERYQERFHQVGT